jgi:hypothetical protein
VRRHLRLDPEMSRRLGKCGLSRNATVRFLTRLRDDLENRYSLYSALRHPEEERFFHFFLAVADGDLTHRFWFVIADATSPDDLFLMDFRHECDPA